MKLDKLEKELGREEKETVQYMTMWLRVTAGGAVPCTILTSSPCTAHHYSHM